MNKWCVTVVDHNVYQYGPFETRIGAMEWAAEHADDFAGRKVIVHRLRLIDVRALQMKGE